MKNTKRLFIASSLHRKLSMKLSEVSHKRSHWPVNWVPEKNYHLTLIFLGKTEESDMSKICEIVASVAQYHSPFDLRFSHWEIYPSRSLKRAKIVWLRSRFNHDLQLLHRDLLKNLRNSNLSCEHISPEIIRPHITLGRIKKRPHPAFTFTPSLPDETLEFKIKNLTVYESKLAKVKGQSSKYIPIESFELNSTQA